MISLKPDIEMVYCHGLPGSAEEVSNLMPRQRSRLHVLKPLDFDDYNEVILRQNFKKVHIVGFSLGAMTALKIAARYPKTVSKISLIAPAVPLELGDFLPNMAGQAVFKIASKSSVLFSIFMTLQRLGVKVAPQRIIKAMFTGSPQADMDLLSNPKFQNTLLDGLRTSLGQERRSYRKTILTYVKPWASDLKNVRCQVSIHHGTDDSWTPIDMTHALAKDIKSDVKVMTYEKLGHYSTLHRALPAILQE